MIKLLVFWAALFAAAHVSASPITWLPGVPAGTQNNVLFVPFTDPDDPTRCVSATLTHTTTGLTFVVTDNTGAFSDTFTQTDSTLEAVTGSVFGYEAPSATKARFEIIPGFACLYVLHLPNAAFAQTDTEALYIQASDGGVEIMDEVFGVDLSVLGFTEFLSSFLGSSHSGYTTANTIGKSFQVDIPAAVTGIVAVDEAVDDVAEVVNAIPASIAAIDTALYRSAVAAVTSSTVVVATEGPSGTDDHVGRSLCVRDADAPTIDADCAVITDFNAGTLTFTLANALDFTVAAGDLMFVPALDARIIGVDDSVSIPVGSTRPRARLTPTP